MLVCACERIDEVTNPPQLIIGGRERNNCVNLHSLNRARAENLQQPEKLQPCGDHDSFRIARVFLRSERRQGGKLTRIDRQLLSGLTVVRSRSVGNDDVSKVGFSYNFSQEWKEVPLWQSRDVDEKRPVTRHKNRSYMALNCASPCEQWRRVTRHNRTIRESAPVQRPPFGSA